MHCSGICNLPKASCGTGGHTKPMPTVASSSRLPIRRLGNKRPFRYELDGLEVDEETALRIDSLGIPPAWTDVRIAKYPGARLQATGFDAAGRKQYLYHPDFR